jgi:hypothetical protein
MGSSGDRGPGTVCEDWWPVTLELKALILKGGQRQVDPAHTQDVKVINRAAIVAQTVDQHHSPNSQEAEAGGHLSPGVWYRPGGRSEFLSQNFFYNKIPKIIKKNGKKSGQKT